MNVFIDTNIYLKFYHYSSEELEELRKLIVLIEQKKINLIIPKQVFNEFSRNRETKISDALKTFRSDKLEGALPMFFKEYPEFRGMKNAIAEFNKNKKAILEKILVDIENYSLKADEITTEIFQKAILIAPNDILISNAKNRFDLGNPPGKNNSYGDAINWETVLTSVPINEDLVFISDDKDYFSEIDNTKFNRFLQNEWKNRNSSNIIFFKSISQFFKNNYPEIKLASDLKKDLFIEKFVSSGSFRESRVNLYHLSNFEDFTSDQLNKIFTGTIENRQIFLITDDGDINSILFEIIDRQKEKISEIILTEFLSKVDRLVGA